MKSTLALSTLIFFVLAGCGSEEKVAEPVVNDTPAEKNTSDIEAAPAAEEEVVVSEERPQAVEESGGQADATESKDKPIILAQTAAPATRRNWQFTEGEHFHRLVPTQPTLGSSDKVEVAEFFWYGCVHCYEFENHLTRWEQTMPANARFVRIPATWNPLVKLHAQLYYTEQVLVGNGKIKNPAAFRAGVFTEYHRRGNRLTSQKVIQALFVKYGVSAEDFESTWGSFEVAQKLRVAQDLARRYAITGVPAMVVNGKYRSGKAEMGTYPKLLELVDELIARETVR